MKNKNYFLRRGFTLIELLVVIAIIAVLSVVVILTLNPGQLLSQSRDSNRLSDISTLSSAINLYSTDQSLSSNYSLGTPGVIYISVPDPTATTTAGTNCAGLGLSGSYHCPASSTYKNTNGTGWIPVNFSNISSGAPLSALPVDPINIIASNQYYQYQTDGAGWEFTANPESQKYQAQAIQNSATFISGSNPALAGSFATSATGTFTVTTNGLLYSRVSQLWTATLTIKNTGSSTAIGPFYLLINNLGAPATLANATGMVGGIPYITVTSTNSLAPGSSTLLSAQFSAPSTSTISFTPSVQQGTP